MIAALSLILAGTLPLAHDTTRARGAADFPRWMTPAVTIGSLADHRLRTAQLLGQASPDGFLLRSASSLSPRPAGDPDRSRWAVVPPELRVVTNSRIPYVANENGMVPGRGPGWSIAGGVSAEAGPLRLRFVPQLTYAANRASPMLHGLDPERSAFASPWYRGAESADLPSRFGNRSVWRAGPGQSSLAASFGGAAAGISSENQWWGPGMRNALVMSNHAPGFPHLFLRTDQPLHTRFGAVEARWIVGGLTESLYFDDDQGNDLRSLSGFAATVRPGGEPNLALGAARVVYRRVPGALHVPTRALDVFLFGGQRGLEPEPDSVEQIVSVFGRWLFPGERFEVYGEWARMDWPASLRDLLIAPNHSQGYTLGMQWATPMPRQTLLRLQGEITYMDESATYRQRPVRSFYTSPVVPQGYTHRGQVIGAAIGPGGSSQWMAADLLGERFQVGGFAGRIRWNNVVHHRVRPHFRALEHDVSLHAGIRAGARAPGFDVSAEWMLTSRLNYLFQSRDVASGTPVGLDVRNHTLRLVVSPSARSH